MGVDTSDGEVANLWQRFGESVIMELMLGKARGIGGFLASSARMRNGVRELDEVMSKRDRRLREHDSRSGNKEKEV